MSTSASRIFLGGLSNRATELDVERFFKGFGKIKDINLKTGYGFVEFEDYRDADDAVYEMNNQSLLGGRVTVEHAKGVPRNRNSYGGSGGGGSYGGTSGGYGSRSSRGAPDYGVGRDYGGGRDSYGSSRDYGNGGGSRYSSRDDRGYGGRSSSKYAPSSRTKYRCIIENVSSRVGWQDLKDHFRQVGEITYAEAHDYIKGEGVVEFATYDDLKTAIAKMDGSELYGRKIKMVEEKANCHSRSRSQSKSRSRSPRRSRSPLRSRSRSMSRGKGRNAASSRSRSPESNHKNRNKSYSRSPVKD